MWTWGRVRASSPDGTAHRWKDHIVSTRLRNYHESIKIRWHATKGKEEDFRC